jgi:hypothetical protein
VRARWWPAALAILVVYRCLLGPPILTDESWFLQVVTRVAAGETLYRDVFFGSTPLAVWLAEPFARAGGGKLLALRLLFGLIQLAMVALAARIAWQLRLPGRGLLLAAALLFTLQHFSYYSPLAMMFLLACYSAALSWRETRAPGWLIVAAAAAALSTAAKYHVGLAACGALLLTILWNSSLPLRSRWGRAAAACGMYAAFTLLLLTPVLLSGAAPAFADYVLLNKTRYVQLALDRFAPAVEFRKELAAAGSLRGLLDLLFSSYLLLLLTPLSVGLLAAAFRRAAAREPDLAWPALFFTAAGLSLLIPHALLPHLLNAAPILLLALAYAWRHLPRTPAWLSRAALAWAVCGWLWVGARPLPHLFTGKWVRAAIHPYTGMWMNREHAQKFEVTVAGLQDAMRAGKRPLLITNDAGGLYLATGLRNPTPFDLPASTALGRHGEEELIAALAAGRFPAVCVNEDWPGGVAPRRLIAFLRRHRQPGADLGSCVLYEAAP